MNRNTLIRLALALGVACRTSATAAEYLSPVALAVSPDGARAHVACAATGTVQTIDLARGKVIATIPVAPDPTSLEERARQDLAPDPGADR